MIIYNITVSIEKEVEDQWVKWMLEEHIPKVMATGLFTEYRFAKVLYSKDEGGVSYSIQYLCNSLADLQTYLGSHAPALQNEFKDRFDGRYVEFQTVLQTVE